MNSVDESSDVTHLASPAESRNLLRIARLAEALNNDQVRDDALSAAERIAEGRFYVACVGQFKRGKSTVLNALIGQPILPSGVVPVTAVPTVVRFGEAREARVRMNNGSWTRIDLAGIERYASQNHNPENTMGVAGLEVLMPSPLLAEGMCLVDTPGIGSVFAGNTAVTRALLPHIDAAIVVLGADPPIAGDELALVEDIASEVPDVVFVLNKADRCTEGERGEAVSFARRVLETRLRRPVGPIFEISALEHLEKAAFKRDWSGLVDCLKKLQGQSGRQLVREAAQRSEKRLSRQLLMVVREEQRALTCSLADSEDRAARLRGIAAQAAQSLRDLGFLFLGEQQGISQAFSQSRDSFLKSIREAAHEELDSALQLLPLTNGPRYRRSALQTAQIVARQGLLPWMKTEEENADEAYRETTLRFTHLANDFLSRAHANSGVESTYLPADLSAELGLRAPSGFRFHEYIALALPASPLRYIGDLVIGLVRAHSVIAAEAHGFLDLLLQTNSERVRNDLVRRVTESRQRLEAEIRSVLHELGAVAERALDRARIAYAAGEPAIAASRSRLAGIEAELSDLCGSEDLSSGNP